MARPKVSVLMSVYNRADLVGSAIESILDQTFGDFEFLIVDDGSTDATAAAIDGYNDTRIRLIPNPSNLGIPASLNNGLRAAQGNYVARIDSDDRSLPTRLARQVEFLERHPTVAMVGSGYWEIDPDGNRRGTYALPTEGFALRWGLAFFTPFLSSSVMFRRDEVVDNVGMYNERFKYSQDHEMWARIAARYPVANLGDCLVEYRVHPGSVTSFADSQQYEFLFESCRSYIAAISGFEIGLDRFRDCQHLLACAPDDDISEVDLDGIEETIAFVSDLHQNFVGHFGLSRSQRAESNDRLRTLISGQLVSMAARSTSKQTGRSIGLLRLAAGLHPKRVLSKRFWVAAIKNAPDAVGLGRRA